MGLMYKISGIMIVFSLSIISTMADTLIMQDGSVLMGEILKQEDNTITLKTTYAGTIHIKWDQVESLQSKDPVTIMLNTDELISTRYVNNTTDGITQIKKKDENWKTAFKTENVSYINPDPWRLGQGYKITGRANLALKTRHGNTTKNELDMDGRLEFRSLRDRFTFTGVLENDTNRGEQTEDNWIFDGKYDYFVSKKRYYGIGLSFERDRFSDLELRTVLGPHIGRQFFETRALNLRLEAGLSKVYENNIAADNDDYAAFNWHTNYDQYFFNEFFQLYHRQNGILNLENTNRLTLHSWSGFRFPVKFGFVASVELEFEYDNDPKPTVHKTDTTYRFKLGYQW